jgi:uncharacterized protein with ParB-like and HNH nuclease domain
MPNQYRPEKKTIGELLSVTNPPILVPDWQRNYSWNSSHAEIFWQDLVEFEQKYSGDNIIDKEYFLGSIVIVDNNVSQLLLDGQQRLATAAILLSTLRAYLALFDNNAATRITSKYLADIDDASGKTIFKITLNHYDREFYQREILEPHTDKIKITPKIKSHYLISEVKAVFEKHFKIKYESIGNPKTFHTWALRILKVLTNHISVVAVISTDEDNAAAVFETLNDRGIGLSTPDLLRNYLLRKAKPEDREEIINLWSVVYDLNDDVNVEVFLRHYWVSRAGDVKTRSLYREIKEYLVNSEESSLKFSRDLSDAAEAYRQIVTAQVDDEAANKLLRDIRDLGANMAYPMLLSAYKNKNESYDSFKEILNAIMILWMRYSVIAQLENSKLETLLYSLAKDFRITDDNQPALERMKVLSPNDEIFESRFKIVSITRKDTVRYILREIELHLRPTEEVILNNNNKVHIEHIYPQTPQEGAKWKDHNNLINRLGNLTLLDFKINTKLKNCGFEIKKVEYAGSDLYLTKQLCKLDKWNETELAIRQTNLAKYALSIWNWNVK